MLNVSITGVEDFGMMVSGFTAALSDLSPLWDVYHVTLQGLTASRFAAEGPGWAPLSEPYATYKAAHGGGTILIYSGDLWSSFLGGSGEVFDHSPTEMTWGTSIPYAHYHQEGTGIMPARPEIDKAEVVTALGAVTQVWAQGLGMLAGSSGLSSFGSQMFGGAA